MIEGQASSVVAETLQSLTRLTDCVERLVEQWEQGGEPPDLSHFLPQEQGPIRRLTLAELIKVDLEYRWQHHNEPKRIAEYVREFPELADGGVPADVIYEEFHILRQCGIAVDPAEYIDRFPEQEAELRCLLGLAQPYETTAVYREGAKRALEEVQVGTRFDDFDLLALLGKGAFASVFLARQRSMQRLVALKVSANTGTEHQTLAQLDHDYIVRVFDYRVAADRDLRLLYMQYLPGGTLHSVLQELRRVEPAARSGGIVLQAVQQSLESRGETRAAESHLAAQLQRMGWGELVCWIGARLARALDYAHSRGILHRDVKPANVLLTAEGVPKLADFNISFCSKLAGANPATYFGGSLAYMSPEQLEACNPAHGREPDSLDGRSDLYSLGVVLWELLTGRRPFVDPPVASGWSRMLSVMTHERKMISDNAFATEQDCPPGLVNVLQKALAPDPEDRWSSGNEMAQRLELCLKPRAHDLLFPPRRSWRVRLRPYAVAIIVAIVAVPNVLAGVFNWFYNREQIVKELARSQVPGALEAFDRIQLVVNSIAYPVGLTMAGILAYPLVRAMRRPPTTGDSLDRPALRRLRRRSLYLGRLAAVVGIAEWMLAGIVYPLSLRLIAGPIPTMDSAYFFFSLLLCGLVAAGYPFFGVSYFTVRSVYPALASLDLAAVDDADAIRRLIRRSRIYLMLTAAIPVFAIMAVLAVESQARYALWAFCGSALVGIALASWLFWQLQADLEAILDALGDNTEN